MRPFLVLALLAPGMAWGGDLYPPMKGVEYYCTDSTGQRLELGEVLCITASCQTWMARCEMTANNNMAMWRKVTDGCPGVSLRDRFERLKPAV